MRRHPVALFLLAAVSAPSIASTGTNVLKPGLVVEAVASKWFSETADVRIGDIFLAWSCGKQISKPLNNPYDLFDIELRGPVCRNIQIQGIRGERPHGWELGESDWGITARPRFAGNLETLYVQGEMLAKNGQAVTANTFWEKILKSTGNSHSWLQTWLFEHSAKTFADSNRWNEADDAYKRAINAARFNAPSMRSEVYYQYAEAFLARDDWTNAQKYYQLALSESLKARRDYLAAALYWKGLGTAANRQGTLREAENYFEHHVAIIRKLAPNSMSFAGGISNLGMVAFYRGDLVRAEKFFRQSLSITERLAPGSLDLAKTFNSLGVTLLERGEPTRAEEYFQKAFGLTEKVDGGEGEGSAVLLYNSAKVAQQREDFAGAERYALHALSIAKTIDAQGLAVAKYSNYLGNLNRKLGRLSQAEEYTQAALRIAGKVAPRSLGMSASLNSMGDLHRARSDFARAEQCYREAADIERLLAPGSTALAESLGAWAEMLQMQNRQSNQDIAGKLYDEALRALETQTAHFGGTDGDRSTFRAQHAGIWRGYAELLLDQKNPGAALEVIERSRAQSLMEILVTGHVGIRNGVDRNALEKMHSLRRSLAIKFDNRAALLGQSFTPQQLVAADKDIEKLIAQRQELDAVIRRTSPRYAALAQSKALKLTEIQALLDQDTTLVEYMVDDSRSRVWTVRSHSVAVYDLPPRATLEASARQVYSMLSQNHCTRDNPEWPKAVAKLGHMLLAPIKKELNVKRLAVVGDGALQYIPFGVLSTEESGPPLIANHEIVALPSASVLAALRLERGTGALPRAR